MAGPSTDQARVCLVVPPLASATLLGVVRQSKSRRRTRGSEAWDKHFFVPKQLGWGLDLGPGGLSPAAIVHASGIGITWRTMPQSV